MKNISKLIVIAAVGALAAAIFTGCSYTKIRDTVVNGYMDVQDSVVDGWNDMVDDFVSDAPKYGVEAPSSSGK